MSTHKFQEFAQNVYSVYVLCMSGDFHKDDYLTKIQNTQQI